MVLFCILDSPILFRTLDIVFHNKMKGLKTLVMVHSQVMQE
jgi:hypothetical protein